MIVEAPGEWPVVFIEIGGRQCSWHIAPDDLDLFESIPRGEVVWDGHATVEKYAYIAHLARQGGVA